MLNCQPQGIKRLRILKIILSIILFTFFSMPFCKAASSDLILGAGATFPYPVYAMWAKAYQEVSGSRLNYQPIGSGGGIKQILGKTVDFGASDQPLSAKQLEDYGLVQFPAIIGAIVPVINLEGIGPGQLKLTGDVLANIYLGRIKNWNDPAIKTLNPNLNLPLLPITVVHRSDGSGTTFLFTHYLSSLNSIWMKQIGVNSAVNWPTGIGGKGNEGVAAFVQNIKGAIGYVEFAYAKQSNMSYVQLQNKAGAFITPTIQSFFAAAKNATWQAPDFGTILTNQVGNDSWPIVGASYILMHKIQVQPERGKRVLEFFAWAFQNGKDMALQLDYVPLPDNVIALIKNSWNVIVDKNAKSIWSSR